MKIGPRIKSEREAQGWTQTELADALDIKQSVLSLWENGKRLPSWRNVQPLAGVFQTSTKSFAGMGEHDYIMTVCQQDSTLTPPAKITTTWAKATQKPQISGRDELFYQIVRAALEHSIAIGAVPTPDQLKMAIEATYQIEQAKRDAFTGVGLAYKFDPAEISFDLFF